MRKTSLHSFVALMSLLVVFSLNKALKGDAWQPRDPAVFNTPRNTISMDKEQVEVHEVEDVIPVEQVNLDAFSRESHSQPSFESDPTKSQRHSFPETFLSYRFITTSLSNYHSQTR